MRIRIELDRVAGRAVSVDSVMVLVRISAAAALPPTAGRVGVTIEARIFAVVDAGVACFAAGLFYDVNGIARRFEDQILVAERFVSLMVIVVQPRSQAHQSEFNDVIHSSACRIIEVLRTKAERTALLRFVSSVPAVGDVALQVASFVAAARRDVIRKLVVLAQTSRNAVPGRTVNIGCARNTAECDAVRFGFAALFFADRVTARPEGSVIHIHSACHDDGGVFHVTTLYLARNGVVCAQIGVCLHQIARKKFVPAVEPRLVVAGADLVGIMPTCDQTAADEPSISASARILVGRAFFHLISHFGVDDEAVEHTSFVISDDTAHAERMFICPTVRLVRDVSERNAHIIVFRRFVVVARRTHKHIQMSVFPSVVRRTRSGRSGDGNVVHDAVARPLSVFLSCVRRFDDIRADDAARGVVARTFMAYPRQRNQPFIG